MATRRHPRRGAAVPRTPPETAAERVTRLGIALIRHNVALAAELAASSGMHPTDVKALQALDEAAGKPGGTTMSELAQRLSLSPAAVTALVDRLEVAGLASRQRDERDRRKIYVVLGPTARRFGQEQLAPLAARLANAVSSIDDAGLAAVETFLTELIGAEAASPDQPGGAG